MADEMTLEDMLAVLMESYGIEKTPTYTLENATEDIFSGREVMYFQDSLGSYPVSAVPYAYVLEVLERLRKAGVK